MKRAIVSTTASLLLVGAPLAACGTGSEPDPDAGISVVLDFSPTNSDAGALLYLASDAEVELRAVTLPGTGESACDPGLEITRALLTTIDRAEVPVACGQETPLAGHRRWPQEWTTDLDTWIGDVLHQTEGGLTRADRVREMTEALAERHHPHHARESAHGHRVIGTKQTGRVGVRVGVAHTIEHAARDGCVHAGGAGGVRQTRGSADHRPHDPLPGAGPGGSHARLPSFTTRLVTEGFFEEDGELWSEDGGLLAQSRQHAVLAPMSRWLPTTVGPARSPHHPTRTVRFGRCRVGTRRTTVRS